MYAKDYSSLKDLVVSLLNNDSDCPVEVVVERVENAYYEGGLTDHQYDELIGYLQDLV